MKSVEQEIADFYAHALAIEREAAARYKELAGQMATHNNPALAALFEEMSRLEARHLKELESRCADLPIPAYQPWQYRWHGTESPESVPYDEVHYLMTGRHALEGALAAERRACDYFRDIAANAADQDLRRLAADLAEEEEAHIRHFERALANQGPLAPDWDHDPDPPQSLD